MDSHLTHALNSSPVEPVAREASQEISCSTRHQIKVALLGAGELGKEVAIECARLGAQVIACDRYDNAPAMHVSSQRYVFDMTDAQKLTRVLDEIKPDLIVPEIEALATEALLDHESRHPGSVVPTATAVHMTMNRERIRKLAAEELGLPTSNYAFCSSLEELQEAAESLGFPVFVKPVMSSSGKGQSRARNHDELTLAWETSQAAGRVRNPRIIAEASVPFESEFTLLTIRSCCGVSFCAPIGHIQQRGDYIESWQPHAMPAVCLAQAQEMSEAIVTRLGGYGLFGVEFFLQNQNVIFSELSPRPHDTGCVTLASQRFSEFALHARALLGLPVSPQHTELLTPAASRAFKAPQQPCGLRVKGVEQALSVPGSDIRIFGKPEVYPGRRMAVVTATGENTLEARSRAKESVQFLRLEA